MPRVKLDKHDVRVIKELIYIGQHTDTEIGDMFGVTRKHINSIRNGKRWKDETETEGHIKSKNDKFKEGRVYIYRQGTMQQL